MCLVTSYTDFPVSPILCLYDEGCGDLSVLRGTGESYGSGNRGDRTDTDLKWVCEITKYLCAVSAGRGPGKRERYCVKFKHCVLQGRLSY